MKKNLKVGVLYGGPSSEREVSLVTGKAVFDNLDRKKYTPYLLEMTKNQEFVLIENNKKTKINLLEKDRRLFDIIFIALHGSPGEDGAVQGMLETLGIKYTGSNVLSSSLAMNKLYSNELYEAHGLPVPPYIGFTKKEWVAGERELIKEIAEFIGFKAVVKPVDQGSAVGVYIGKNKEEVLKNIKQALKTHSYIMVQRFIQGEEATCGILENKREVIILPPTHIIPQANKFYDYKSKYAKGGSMHVCPADFDEKVYREIQEYAGIAHKILGCSGMSRSDFMVMKDGKVFILETNTIPGMTPTSLLPEAAGKAGISFKKMLNFIIESAL